MYEDGFDKDNRKMITVGKVSVKAGKAATLEDVCLTAGDNKYYVAMTAKNVKKVGTEGLYNVSVVESKFFVDADSGDNKEANDNYLVWIGRGAESKPIIPDSDPMKGSTEFKNFVGFGDAADYAKIKLTSDGKLSFHLEASGDAAITVYKKGQDKKGNDTLETIRTDKIVLAKGESKTEKDLLISDLEAGEYYVSVTAKNTKANDKGSVFYNVTATLDASVSSALAMSDALFAGLNNEFTGNRSGLLA